MVEIILVIGHIAIEGWERVKGIFVEEDIGF